MLNELFIKPIHGLYKELAITVEEFKNRHKDILKERWVDMSHEKKGEKIYSMYDPNIEGDIYKSGFATITMK